MCPSVMFLAKVPRIPLYHPMYRYNFYFQTRDNLGCHVCFRSYSRLPFQKKFSRPGPLVLQVIVFDGFFNQKHSHSDNLKIVLLEFELSQLHQRHLLWFHIHFFIHIFDNRPFENVLIYCNLHNYIRDMSQHQSKQSSQCVDFLWCFQGFLQR